MGSQLLFAFRMRLTLALVLTTLAIVAEGNPKPMTVKANVAVKVKSDTPDTEVYGGRAQGLRVHQFGQSQVGGLRCGVKKVILCAKRLVPKIRACDDRDTFGPCLQKIFAEGGVCQDCICSLLEKYTPPV